MCASSHTTGGTHKSSMENKRQPDLLDTQPLQETDEELTADIDYTEIISEEEKEELKNELAKLEDEIVTLRQVLAAKEKHLAEIKHKLGVSMMNELKQNFSRSWQDVQTHSAHAPWSEFAGYHIRLCASPVEDWVTQEALAKQLSTLYQQLLNVSSNKLDRALIPSVSADDHKEMLQETDLFK
ncbi:tumor protein D52-like [Rhinoderma darwinii]|uniref:tumor protein D52-like n=1 Tax=Rhinoderma darwinii TaxID=43563 RepID=UPI003F679DD2